MYTIGIKDDKLTLTVDEVDQFWQPNDDLTNDQVMATINQFEDPEDPRRLVALKRLAHIIVEDPSEGLPSGNPVDPNKTVPENPPEATTPTEGDDLSTADPESQKRIEDSKKPADESQQSAEGTASKNEGAELGDTEKSKPDPPANVAPPQKVPDPEADKQKKATNRGIPLGHDIELTLEELDKGKLDEDLKIDRPILTARGVEITINGQKYVYDPIDPAMSSKELLDKFVRISAHSAGRALAWIKRNAVAIKVREESLTKEWDTKVRAAVAERNGVVDSIIPQEDDWLCEFTRGQGSGSVNANLFTGVWSVQFTSPEGNASKEGTGLDNLCSYLKELGEDD